LQELIVEPKDVKLVDAAITKRLMLENILENMFARKPRLILQKIVQVGTRKPMPVKRGRRENLTLWRVLVC
jgi:hypothetical protein